MATAISRRRAVKPPKSECRHTVYVVCRESGNRHFAGTYDAHEQAEAAALFISKNGCMIGVVDSGDGVANYAPRAYSVANDSLIQVVTIDDDGHEDIVCPCVPEAFGKSFIEMYNRHPSGRRAVGRQVMAVVVGGAA